MKRYILTTISLVIISFWVFGQQQVENPGFEEWEVVVSGPPDIIEPVNWSTIKTGDDPNIVPFTPITWERTTESPHSGQYSVRLFNTTHPLIAAPVTGTICNGRYHLTLNTDLAYSYTVPEDPQWNTPITSRPDSIAFWVKYFPEGGDNLQFQALLHVGVCSLPPEFTNPDNQVAYTRADLFGPYEEWTRISLAFDYYDERIPEYLLMIITSGNGTTPIDGSIAYYDDLEIIYIQSIEDNPFSNTDIYYANGKLMLRNFPNDYLSDASVEIIDVTGRQLWQNQIYSTEIPFNNINLNSGLYIVRITSDKHSFSHKLYIK